MSNIIFTLVSRGFGWNLLRELFTALDGAIFSLFSAVIQLMFDIVNVTASDTFFNSIQSRIYVILSIYMLFKVTISLITYVVNPDSMSDKSQGVGKLVQRIMIAMVMLMLFPTVFQKLTDYQKDIIEDHTIDNIILGASSITDEQNTGDSIGVAVYDGFIIRPANNNLSDDKVSTIGLEKVSDASRYVNDPMGPDQKDTYKYEYTPLIGFALGILMTLLILSFCIELAMRVFKLIILQLIAPIPIISYIDPKASKDGAFNKWIKMVGTTWASLFVRLVVIDFILLLIREVIGGSDAALKIESGGIMVRVALIIGLLFFAKNLPKFIGDALGIKIEGGLFTGLGQIAAAGAIGLGTVGAGFAGFSASRMAGSASGKNNILKNIGAGLFGAVGGFGAGVGAGINAKDHSSKAVMDAMNKRNAAAIAAGAAGSTWWGRTRTGIETALTGQNAAMRGERSIAAMQAQKDALSNVKSRMSGEMPKAKWTTGSLGLKSVYGDGDIMANYKTFMASYNAAKSAGSDQVVFNDSKGREQIISMEEAEMNWGLLLKNNEDDYIQHAVEHGDNDMAELIDIAEKTGVSISDRASVNDTIEKLGHQITRAKAENDKNKQDARFSGK